MKKEILCFELNSTFGFFNNKEDKENNSSYLSLHPAATLGILGSILGLKGFSDFKKNKNRLEYLDKLKDIKINIEILNKNFPMAKVGYNDATMLGIGKVNKGYTFQYTEECLVNPSYKIRLLLDLSNEVHYKLKEMIINKQSYYNQCFGRTQFFTAPENIYIEHMFQEGEADMFIGIHDKDLSYFQVSLDDADEDALNGFDYAKNMFFQLPISLGYDEKHGVAYNRFELVSFDNYFEKENLILLHKNDIILYKDNKAYQFYGF